jgi:hypothetical protein
MNEIWHRGCAALVRELGPEGFVRFVQHLQQGKGDYTRERRKWVDSVGLPELRQMLSKGRRKRTRGM